MEAIGGIFTAAKTSTNTRRIAPALQSTPLSVCLFSVFQTLIVVHEYGRICGSSWTFEHREGGIWPLFSLFNVFFSWKVNWSKSSSRLLLWSWRTKRWTSQQFYAPAMWGRSSSTGGLITKQRRVLFSHFPACGLLTKWPDGFTVHLSVCVSVVFQPVVTLDGATSFTFSKEGSHTVSVQASVGNTVLQDQMNVAVYGKSYIHIFTLLLLWALSLLTFCPFYS